MNYIKGSRTDCSLLTRDDYLYIRNKMRNGKVYLRCRLKTCECTAQWEPTGDRFTTTSSHNHAADPIDVEVLKLKAEIKSQASWDNRPFKKVFDEVCAKYSRETVTRVDFPLFYNSIRRSRSRLFKSLSPFRKTRKRKMKVQYGSEESSFEMSGDSPTHTQMTVTNNSEAAFKEEDLSNDVKLAEVVDMLQPTRIKEETLELEDIVEVDNSYQEASEIQDQGTERNICKPALELKEPNLPFKENSSENSNEIMRLLSVVSKLERVSDQIAVATFGDSYDQFGKYIATLLRGLPQSTVISLKQQMVQAVLNVKFAEEQNQSISETPNESEKSPVVSPLQISDTTNFASVKALADNSHNLSVSLQNQMISDNIDTCCTFTGRPSASILPTGGTSSTPSSNLTGDILNLSTIRDIDNNSQKFNIPQEIPNSSRTLLLDQMPLRKSESTSQQLFTLHQKTELSDHCSVPKQPKLQSNKKKCKEGAEQQSKQGQKQFLLSKEPELLVSVSNTEVPMILQSNRKENPKTYSKEAKISNSNMNSEVDFPMDIEENEELANLKQNQDSSFETIFCDSLLELKQEPPDNEEDHYMSGDSSHHS